jgi:hypothetical protein
MPAFAGLLTPAVMFFALGAGAQACRSDLKFPPDLVKALSIYLLVGIGLHGGAELANASLGTAIQAVLAALVLGAALPLIGAACGLAVGHYWLSLGAGGTTLVAVLGASASYIAVPPAVRMAIPEASPSLYLTLSLGITFPFNVVVGIPLYHSIAEWLAA